MTKLTIWAGAASLALFMAGAAHAQAPLTPGSNNNDDDAQTQQSAPPASEPQPASGT